MKKRGLCRFVAAFSLLILGGEMSQASSEDMMSIPADHAIARLRVGEPRHLHPLPNPPTATDWTEAHRPALLRHEVTRRETEVVFALEPDEALWGFGLRMDAFNQRGRRFDMWATDSWNRTDTSYGAVPFFISSKGYGLFVNNPGRVIFDNGLTQGDELRIQVPEGGAEIIVFYGTPAEVVEAYTHMIGRPVAVPDWMYSLWTSRNSYLGAYEVDRVVNRMAAIGMPVGAVVLEAWAESLHNFRFTEDRYPEPEAWIRSLHERDCRVICWITPSIWPHGTTYREAVEKGYLVLNPDGSEMVTTWLEGGRKIDFDLPEARAWWTDLQRPLIAMGVDGIKTDGGERNPQPFFHNLHPFYYKKASLDAFEGQPQPPVTFARAVGAMCAGASAVWAGDQHADWHSLPWIMRGGLAAALSGFPLWSHDIGGYSGTPDKELYLRWLQIGAFSPIFQLHGITAREPWHYDEETIAIAGFYGQVRERLRPYLESLSEGILERGEPIWRPLVWHHPEDRATWSLGDQVYLGPDLIVAPVIDQHPRRRVYLPEGEWVDLWTGEAVTGPATLSLEVALDQTPVFARAEAAEAFAGLFADRPAPQSAVAVKRGGIRNERGIPRDRWLLRGAAVEKIFYTLVNTTGEEVIVDMIPDAPSGFGVEPARMTYSVPAHGETRVIFFVTPPETIRPGRYPVSARFAAGSLRGRAPEIDLVVPGPWALLGPFAGGVGSQQRLDGQRVNTSETFTGRDDKSVQWTPVPQEAIKDDGMIDVGSLIDGGGGSTFYLSTMVFSAVPRTATFRVGSGDEMQVWVNGESALHVQGHRNPERDEDTFSAPLREGNNEVLIRVSRDLATAEVFFREVEE